MHATDVEPPPLLVPINICCAVAGVKQRGDVELRVKGHIGKCISEVVSRLIDGDEDMSLPVADDQCAGVGWIAV